MNSGLPGTDPSLSRSPNTARVLDLLRTAGGAGISRLELAERTGLTPQAVSRITARLRDAGLLAAAGHRASTGGKPRTVLRLVRGARRAVGLHLERDEMTAVLVDLTGEPLVVRTVPFDFGADAESVLDAVAEQVAALLRQAAADGTAEAVGDDGRPPQERGDLPRGPAAGEHGAVLALGVACPGPLDHARGVLHRVTGLPQWDGFPLREALSRRLGLPVVLDKDANAAALGLALAGGGGWGGAPGRTCPATASFAYLHLGTGLGAGLVLDGALYRGARTAAGEFGHQVIELDGPPCACGGRGCVEALCLAAIGRGDLERAAHVLGAAAANLVALLDIDEVVLGGRTVAAAAGALTRGVARALAGHAARDGGRPVPVSVAAAGSRVVADGAAQLVLAPLFGRAETPPRAAPDRRGGTDPGA